MQTSHHYIFGKSPDYLTGEVLEDTHDERHRQKIARFLVEEKGYAKGDIVPRRPLPVTAGLNSCVLSVDFSIAHEGRTALIIRYAPGSLVTRQRPSLAASRLLEDYQIPLVAVTNGEDAELLDGQTGKVLGAGLESLPSREELAQRVRDASFSPIDAKRREMESRIIFTYEMVGACNCDACS